MITMKVYNQVNIEKFYQCKYGLNICNLIVQLEMVQPHAATSFCTETNFLIFVFPLCKSIYKIKYLRMKSCHKVFFQRFTFVFKKGILIFFYKKKNRYLAHLVYILHPFRCLQVRDIVALPFCNLISLKKTGVRARVCICTWENEAKGFQQSRQGQK